MRLVLTWQSKRLTPLGGDIGGVINIDQHTRIVHFDQSQLIGVLRKDIAPTPVTSERSQRRTKTTRETDGMATLPVTDRCDERRAGGERFSHGLYGRGPDRGHVGQRDDPAIGLDRGDTAGKARAHAAAGIRVDNDTQTLSREQQREDFVAGTQHGNGIGQGVDEVPRRRDGDGGATGQGGEQFMAAETCPASRGE